MAAHCHGTEEQTGFNLQGVDFSLDIKPTKEIAREMLEQVKDRVAGAYIMPPFGRYQLALDIIDGIVR